ncbi:MAG: hypothetical protein WC613_02875 [Candidatus Aenigmatarchaeota archaeon]
MVGAQGGLWTPSDREDHCYDEHTESILERRELELALSIDGQKEIFRNSRSNQLGFAYGEIDARTVQLSHEELEALRNPDTPGDKLFRLLYKKLQP